MALIDRERLVCIGKVMDAHGMQGELKVKPYTGTPGYYEHTRRVILDAGAGLSRYPVRAVRGTATQWIFALEGVETRRAAQSLKGAEVLLEEGELRPLEPGEYFMDDLLGCAVLTVDDEPVGQVRGVIDTGANGVLEVTAAAGEVLVPMTGEVVKEVDVAARRIRIAPLPNLLDPDA